MIDPIESLAFSVQANPKVYALLLGSGVSRASQIPTGWEVIEDLLGKLATSMGEASVANLEEWYVQKYREVPDYSKILHTLAKTPSERQQLLRPYFEPDDQQLEDGLKQPTVAHRAIARLVAQGFIKVIVTTNFDQLLEKALSDENVTPTVLSTPDQVQGALPLDHIDYCLFKVHGDYLDTRIRNTQSELERYPEEYEQLLQRIFNEYGLIVCGWSGSWDTALRDALFRAKSRRFTTYWASHGETTNEAKQLICHRQAQVVPIADADSFFEDVQRKVEAIDEYSRPHPLSTSAAVSSLKRYLPRTEYRIQLLDLIDVATDKVLKDTTGKRFELDHAESDSQTIAARLSQYDSACSTLLHMASVGGYWANEDNCIGWERAAQRLVTTAYQQGSSSYEWMSLQFYPGVLLLYAFGLGAVEGDQLHILNRIFRRAVTSYSKYGASQSSNILTILLTNRDAWGRLNGKVEGIEESVLPVSDKLHRVLIQPLTPLIPDEQKYSLVFDKFEILAAMAFNRMQGRAPGPNNWFLPGAYIVRSQRWRYALADFEDSLQEQGDESSLAKSGIIGNTARQCLSTIHEFRETIPKMAMHMGIYY